MHFIKKEKRDPSYGITEGPLFSRIFTYTVPIILSGILQLLYNAADNVVIGNSPTADPHAIGAVGSTGALTNLLVNLLFGLSVGTGVVVAKAYGAKNEKQTSDAVHTSMAVSFIGGILFGLLGFFLSKPLLEVMGTKPEHLELAQLYMKIYFCGMPANAVYNFGAAVLRAKGDTKRPMIILSCSGIANVLLNIVFVNTFHWDVAGVASATIIAQYISAVAIVILLTREKDSCRLIMKKLTVKWKIFKELIKIGLPSGAQGCFFSLSNVIIQSAVNSLPFAGQVDGNTVASTIEGFVYTSMNSYYHTALTFTGQNLGAYKYDRIKKTAIYTLIQVSTVGLIIGFSLFAFAEPVALLIKPDKEIAKYALVRMTIILPTYFTCGIMDVLVGNLRALGHSTLAMLSALFGSCILRIIWVKGVFPIFRSNASISATDIPTYLYISYPISWVLTDIILLVSLIIVLKKLKAKMNSQSLPQT